MAKITFYLPDSELIDNIPADFSGYWEWLNYYMNKDPDKRPFGGPYNWTMQAYLCTRDLGFSADISDTVPSEGIVMAHSDFLKALKPNKNLFVVELKPDRKQQCFYAHTIVIQNKKDPVTTGFSSLYTPIHHVTLWPQPNLIPRDPARGDKFENIAFVGNVTEMQEELTQFQNDLVELGLNWRVVPRESWHDYSDIDAVVALRSTSLHPIDTKPGTKLYNAWLAGVPAILSPDSAFEQLRTSELDYLIAKTPSEALEHVKTLKDNIELRQTMIEHGNQRGLHFTTEKVAQEWIDLIEQKIVPCYEKQQRSSIYRAYMSAAQSVLVAIEFVKLRIQWRVERYKNRSKKT